MYGIELSRKIRDLMSLKSQSILLHLISNYMNNNDNNKQNKGALDYLCKIFKYFIDKQFKYNRKYRAVAVQSL